jgi:phage gp29-like protein
MRTALRAKRHTKRDATGRFVKLRTNGQHMLEAQSTMNLPISSLRARTTRATQFNWILPSVGAVTPTYLEMILRGALAGNHVQQYQLFDLMMDSWPELSAAVQELTYGVTRREIIFDPFTEEDEKPTASAVERTKLVSAVMRRMQPMAEQDENGLKGTVTDLMDGWFRGIVVMEVMWDTFDLPTIGMATGPRATAWVQPQTYGFNQQGVLGYNTAQYYTDTSAQYYAPSQLQLDPFPPDKFLVGIHKVKSGSPLGGPMLRALAWWWCAANFSADWLLNLAQVFGLPFRWATYPGAAPTATVNAITDMLANMGSSGWGAFPEGTTLDLKEAGATRSESPQAHLLDRADRYARSLILGQTMTGATMASGRGGQAFGTVEAQLKQDRLEAASAFVADVFNEQLIPSILRLNYGDEDEAPVCRFLQENEGTYQDAQRDQILAQMGTPIPISHIRKKYSIPEPEGDEEVLQPIPKAAPQPSVLGPDGKPLPLTEKAALGQPVSEQQQNRADERQKEVLAARLVELAKITDDEVFGREFKRLTTQIAAEEK